ncbi:MAG: hypothetical protein Q7U06_00470 [Pseudomonadota bacterium]|nr:hypothetical protein [Pseudomonadota bacterium]
MSKYIWTREDGERVVVDLDEDEAALVEAAIAADDDDEGAEDDEGDDGVGSEDEPSREADTPAEFARVEEVYRKERAAIRASSDATDLRVRRQAMERALGDARQSKIVHIRARDLLGEIEQRELRLRAERLATRER